MGKRKVVTVNTRNSGEQTFGHGGTDPKALGPTKGNDKATKKTMVSTRPANADKDFDAGQHGDK